MTSQLDRRDFLRALGLGLITTPILLESLKGTLLAQTENPQRDKSIIWYQGMSSGVQSQFFGALRLEREFLQNYFNFLDFEGSNLSEEEASSIFNNILILDGYYSSNPNEVSYQMLKKLVAQSQVVILMGSEACFMNAPEGFANLDQDILYPSGVPFIKIPGDPAQSFHLLACLNHILLYGLPDLDEFRRPSMLFSNRICDACEHRDDFERGHFLTQYGESTGCLYQLGCKGPYTKNTCATDRFNQFSNWCIGAGSPCTGCSEPNYPHNAGLGLFGQLDEDNPANNGFFVRNLGAIGLTALGVTLTGLATHAVSQHQQTKSGMEPKKESKS